MFNYSIHGVLKVSSNIKLDSLIRLPIPSCFQTDEDFSEADIEIFQHNLDFRRPEGNEVKRVSYFYWQEGSKLFIDFAGTGAKLAIDDLAGRAKVEFNPRFKRLCRDASELLLLRILFIKLIQRGYTFAHSGCVKLSRSGILITALPDIGKTSTVLSLVGRGYRFLGDDYIILSEDGWAYSYPQGVKVSPRTRTGGVVPPPRLWKRIFGRTNLTNVLAIKLFGNMIDFREVPTKFLEDKVQIKRVFMLGGYNREGKVERVSCDKVVDFMFLPLYVSDFPDSYADLYCYLYKIDFHRYLGKGREIVRKALRRADCFELKAPSIEMYPELIWRHMHEMA